MLETTVCYLESPRSVLKQFFFSELVRVRDQVFSFFQISISTCESVKGWVLLVWTIRGSELSSPQREQLQDFVSPATARRRGASLHRGGRALLVPCFCLSVFAAVCAISLSAAMDHAVNSVWPVRLEGEGC